MWTLRIGGWSALLLGVAGFVWLFVTGQANGLLALVPFSALVLSIWMAVGASSLWLETSTEGSSTPFVKRVAERYSGPPAELEWHERERRLAMYTRFALRYEAERAVRRSSSQGASDLV